MEILILKRIDVTNNDFNKNTTKSIDDCSIKNTCSHKKDPYNKRNTDASNSNNTK